MEGFAVVKTGSKKVYLKMTELECVTMVVFRNGYEDMDLDDTGNGVVITATGKSGSVTGRGKTVEEACERLVEKVVKA